MAELLNILVAVLVVSMISFVGALILFFNVKRIEKRLFPLVSFAAGAMIAVALLDLIPEAAEHAGDIPIFMYVLGGVIIFFIVEKLLYWYHCHDGMCEGHHHGAHPAGIKPFAYLNLVGDGIHNLLDGAIVAISFMVDTGLGIATTIAVIFHEIPQEIGDFSVLIYSGLTRAKALFYNFLSALMALVGALLAFSFTEMFEAAEPMMLAFAAGGFLYISLADLIPELHHDQQFPKSMLQLVWFGIGVLIIYVISVQFGVAHG